MVSTNIVKNVIFFSVLPSTCLSSFKNFERMNDRAVAAINERRTGLSEAVFYREDSAGEGSWSYKIVLIISVKIHLIMISFK